VDIILVLVNGGQEEAPGIFDLRFAIFEQRAKQGSLTFESESGASAVVPQAAEREKTAGRSASVRLGPTGTAWDRINFFLSKNGGKNQSGRLWLRFARPQPVVVCRNMPG
jgi:hypothetical protein